MKKFKRTDFNTYDMLVFRSPDTSITQDCVVSVGKTAISCSLHSINLETGVCLAFIPETLEREEVELLEIWTRTDEDTYKRVWKNNYAELL